IFVPFKRHWGGSSLSQGSTSTDVWWNPSINGTCWTPSREKVERRHCRGIVGSGRTCVVLRGNWRQRRRDVGRGRGSRNFFSFKFRSSPALSCLWRRRNPVSYTHLRAHETDSYLVC